MEELNTILERIATFNINANTDIDIQAIVEKYIMWSTFRLITTTFLWCILVLIIATLIYKLVNKTIKLADNEVKTKKVEEFLKGLNSWDSVKDVKRMLEEVLEYMPRNKKKRNL